MSCSESIFQLLCGCGCRCRVGLGVSVDHVSIHTHTLTPYFYSFYCVIYIKKHALQKHFKKSRKIRRSNSYHSDDYMHSQIMSLANPDLTIRVNSDKLIWPDPSVSARKTQRSTRY
jgi:hypothetical protein